MVSQDPRPRCEPAPLDRCGLEQALRPFGESRMLPPAAYTDPGVFAWERRHLFGGWVCVARSEQLPEPGDLRAEAAGEGGVLLARGQDGGLRAFANTCRHRGHELLGCGRAARQQVITCPYHGWTYALSGELRFAAGFGAVPGFDLARWGLRPLPVTEWHGLVFVDASGGRAGSLDEALAGLDELVAPYEPERLVTAARHGYDCAANWKILAENYHECYHCPSIHPELCRVSPPKSGENYAADGAWMGGWMDLRDGAATMSLDGRSGGVPLRGLSGRSLRTVIYVQIFPNVLLSLHPDYVMTHVLVPVAADRTRVECSWAFAPEAAARPGSDPAYAVEFWDLTNRQDWSACESVQRGLSSPHASAGPLSPAEDAVYSFVTTVARAYLGRPPRGAAAGRPVACRDGLPHSGA
jgi:Rieske 2Fe-2S family protein